MKIFEKIKQTLNKATQITNNIQETELGIISNCKSLTELYQRTNIQFKSLQVDVDQLLSRMNNTDNPAIKEELKKNVLECERNLLIVSSIIDGALKIVDNTAKGVYPSHLYSKECLQHREFIKEFGNEYIELKKSVDDTLVLTKKLSS